ncbi:MAG: MFS transporter [Clostridia bacterium]
MNSEFKLTKISCYVAIMFQAVSCNIIALLFIPFMSLYGFSYVDLGMLVAVNFGVQIAVDIIFSPFIDKIGYKKLVLLSVVFGFVGFMILFSVPYVFNNKLVGIIIATVVFSTANGLLEVLVSPIADAIPSDDKGASMSFMHSFYAWGQVIFITVTTVLLYFLKIDNWQLIVLFWSVIPVVNFIMFTKAKFPKNTDKTERRSIKSVLFKPFFIVAVLAIFFGAAGEVVINQWRSSFMEKALMLPKITGDLLGMCGFAVALGAGRLLYGLYGKKFDLNKTLILGSIITTLCYLIIAISPYNFINVLFCAVCGFSASLLWPGTLVVTSNKFAMSGAWLFAILAAAGDIGGSVGPYITGFIIDNVKTANITAFISNIYNITSEQAAIRIGILIAAIFPLLAVVCHLYLKKHRNK